MIKTAVIAADGCEEGELLTIADILRRAGFSCELTGLEGSVIKGAHDIVIAADRVLDMSVSDYDMIILPGGYGGVDRMKQSELLMAVLCKMNSEGKFVTAMCAAPAVLDAAGLLEGKRFTAYKGYDEKIKSGTFLEDEVVQDGNLITGRAPATVYSFSYALVKALGGDYKAVADRMIYNHAFDKEI